jgi:hypothetical protein
MSGKEVVSKFYGPGFTETVCISCTNGKMTQNVDNFVVEQSEGCSGQFTKNPNGKSKKDMNF